jgi:hypothetical protein
MISVADTGTGIGAQDVERVFQSALHHQIGRNGYGPLDLPFDNRSTRRKLWVEANAPRGSVFQFVLSADTATPVSGV